jgi:hydroxyethylthiazole kinase-like uncharacterized protein yjeF
MSEVIPIKYVSVSEMQAIERQADASGLTYALMMENAGRNLADAVLDVYGFLEEAGAVGLVGSGNNGGDTLVALAHLASQGWSASAYVVRLRPKDDPLISRLLQSGGQVSYLEDDPSLEELRSLLSRHDVLMDGVLGTGMRLPLKEGLAELLGKIKAILTEMEDPPVVIAVDVPSGVDCDNGLAAPECLPADLTVTMAAIKHGLLKFPAFTLIGDLRVVGIGLPDGGQGMQTWQDVRRFVPDENWVLSVLPARPADAHKGTFGTALVVAGSVNYTGAAWLAGQAAYRIGAGLVTLAVPKPLHAALAGQFPEATWLPLPDEDGFIARESASLIAKNLGRATALLLGPGIGLENTTANFLSQLLSGRPMRGQLGFVNGSASRSVELPPLVVDADGLKLLAGLPGWPASLPAPAVLTPHPGEMAVLTGLSKEEIQADRLGTAERFSQEWGHVVVLKGAFSVIAAPDGQTAIIPVATPALARAGTGDVLAGLIVGLLAQGVEPFSAAVAAAWIHAQAGLHAAADFGSQASVMAGDLLRCVPDVLNQDLGY